MEKGIPKKQLNVFMGKSKLPSIMEDYIKSLNQNKDE
jgi:competence CoiA-like predicted nuclease